MGGIHGSCRRNIKSYNVERAPFMLVTSSYQMQIPKNDLYIDITEAKACHISNEHLVCTLSNPISSR